VTRPSTSTAGRAPARRPISRRGGPRRRVGGRHGARARDPALPRAERLRDFTQIRTTFRLPGMTVISISYGNTEGNEGPRCSRRTPRCREPRAGGRHGRREQRRQRLEPDGGNGAGYLGLDGARSASTTRRAIRASRGSAARRSSSRELELRGEVVWNQLADASSARAAAASAAFSPSPSWQTGRLRSLPPDDALRPRRRGHLATPTSRT
jgi:hypothetical protein